MLDSLIMATALLASQGTYGMPSSPPPVPPPERPAAPAAEPAPPPQPAVPAVPGKTLRDLPNTTITYFDISGRNLKAINKAMERQQSIGAGGRAATTWSVDAGFNKVVTNGQCKVANAKATFSAKVSLPRLVPDSAHKPQLLAAWRAYAAGVENAEAASLWFVYDRLRDVENAISASSCDSAPAAGSAAIERLKAQAAEFQRSRVTQAAK